MVPSVRLKAYRRGQQDVEYLTLWAHHRGLPRWAVGRQVRETLHLSGSRRATETGGAEDAGRIEDSALRPQDLWALRVRVGKALSRFIPPRSTGWSSSAPRRARPLKASTIRKHR